MAKAKAKATEDAPASIPERIAPANEKIAALRDERAQAMLEGKDFAQFYPSEAARLADPTGYVPGTHMVVGFEPDRAVRIPLIAYLRTLADEPVPLQ